MKKKIELIKCIKSSLYQVVSFINMGRFIPELSRVFAFNYITRYFRTRSTGVQSNNSKRRRPLQSYFDNLFILVTPRYCQ